MRRRFGPPEPIYGRRVLFGQFTHAEMDRHGRTVRIVDEAERRNFDKAKYVPGNGPDHRLGKRGN